MRSLAEPVTGSDGQRRTESDHPAGEQTELPRSFRRDRSAGRSCFLLQSHDGGDEGTGNDVDQESRHAPALRKEDDKTCIWCSFLCFWLTLRLGLIFVSYSS